VSGKTKHKLSVVLATPWPVYPLKGSGMVIISKIIKVLTNEGISCYLLQPSEELSAEEKAHADGGVIVNYERAPRLLRFMFKPFKTISTSLWDALLFTFNYEFLSKKLRLIKKEGIDCILCYNSLQFLPTYFIARITKRPLILILGDVLFVTYYRARKILRQTTPPYPIVYLTFLIEKLSTRVAERIVVLSDHDKEFLCQHSARRSKIEVIRQSIDLAAFDLKLEQSGNLERGFDLFNIPKDAHVALFHGDLNYPPNRRACEYIINDFEPEFRKRSKDIVFVIAGPNPPKDLMSKNENVIFTGFVENLPALIKLADIGIVPIVSGGGVRNKILDYFACSKPVISTRIGAEGLEVKNMEHLILVDDVQDIPNKICLVLDSPELASKLGQNARKYVESKHTLKNFEKYVHMIKEVSLSKSEMCARF